MKTVSLFVLIICLSLSLHAQRKRTLFTNLPYRSITESTFGNALNNFMYTHRIRIAAAKKSQVDIRFYNIKHLPWVMNLDSIFNTVWASLLPLKDSFPNDLYNRRIDYNATPNGIHQVRFLTYAPEGSSLVKQANGYAPLKLEQDTLRIIGYVVEEKNYEYFKGFDITRVTKTERGTFLNYMPFEIILTINNLSEIPGLLNNSLNEYMKEIAADYKRITGYTPRRDWQRKVNITFEPLSSFKGDDRYVVYKRPGEKYFVTPIAQAGIQNVKNGFAASASLGISYSSVVIGRPGKDFTLMWEPYFFFDKNGAGKTVIQRNDFVTFEFREKFQPNAGTEVNFLNSFSLGYLLHREGDYFNKNTFKLGLPGMQFRNLLLQPQFFFNDFFKQFYPSVKLQVRMD